MKQRLKSASLGVVVLGALAGCDRTTAPGSGAAAGNSAEAAARQACVRDVRATTGNSDVSVIRSSFSKAGSEIVLRVGPTGTWQCTAYSDGTTANIMSLTDEGAL
jgi:hypothetical protein